MELKIEYVDINSIFTYPNNAKKHTAEQIEQIKESIQRFGMSDPIAIWKDGTIIEGHGRYLACQELGMEKVPIVRLESLTDEQRKAYALVHNQLTMNTGFDKTILSDELDRITEIAMSDFGFQYTQEDLSEFYEDAPESKGRKMICPDCGEVFYIDKDGNVTA